MPNEYLKYKLMQQSKQFYQTKKLKKVRVALSFPTFLQNKLQLNGPCEFHFKVLFNILSCTKMIFEFVMYIDFAILL